MYGPGPPAKRPDIITPTPPMARPDEPAFRGMPPFGQQGPYPQNAYPGGDRPMGNQGAYPPGYREGRPSHQGPTPVPQPSKTDFFYIDFVHVIYLFANTRCASPNC